MRAEHRTVGQLLLLQGEGADVGPKWVRLAANGTNTGHFQIGFQKIWVFELFETKCTEI